jgi:hypothetical protein
MKLAATVLVVLVACGPKATPAPNASNARPADPVVETTEGGPYDYRTWTAKLDDPREVERAVTELEQIGNPGAIPALGAAWRTQGRPVRYLQVIISLSRPLTAQDAKDRFVTDYEKTGRPASWKVSMPFLVEALATMDVTNPRSVDSAAKAADAIAEANDPAGVAALVGVATAPISKKTVAVQVGAIRALGTFRGEKRATTALIANLEQAPPAHPRTANTPAENGPLEQGYGLYLAVTGASVNALGALRDVRATKALVLAMYQSPELFVQIRRALVTIGTGVAAELRAVLRGENKAVDAFLRDRKLDPYCGNKGDAKCQPVSLRDYYAAIVVGDLRDPAAVPDLLAALDRPALPVYYFDDMPSPHSQRSGILEALRKLGSPDAATKVRALWTSTKVDVATRAVAIATYPFVVPDSAGVDELGKIAADNTADDTLRQEAATAYARLANDAKQIAILDVLAQKYFKAAADKKKQADGKPKRDADAADKAFEKKKQAWEKSKADLFAITNDATKSADEIRKATDATRKIEDDYKVARKKHREAVAPWKQLDDARKAYRGFARMFQTHVARIEIAIRCKQDLACYAGSLDLTHDASATNAAPYIKDITEWTTEEKLGLLEANIDRAMLELGKSGTQAASHTDVLLAAAKSEVRLIRQAVLLALPKIAKIPCATCEAQLDVAIKAGEGKTTLGDLNVETAMLRNYFAWAGRTP